MSWYSGTRLHYNDTLVEKMKVSRRERCWTYFLLSACRSTSQLVRCRWCSGRASMAPLLGSLTTKSSSSTAISPSPGVTWEGGGGAVRRRRPPSQTGFKMRDSPAEPSASPVPRYWLVSPRCIQDRWREDKDKKVRGDTSCLTLSAAFIRYKRLLTLFKHSTLQPKQS